MEERTRNEYVRRIQKDYSTSIKLRFVQEIESGELSIRAARRKYGIQGDNTVTLLLRKYDTFDWESQTPGISIYIILWVVANKMYL